MDAGVHAMGDDHGMSIDDEPHSKPRPPRSAQESSDPVAPRALSIDEEWAMIEEVIGAFVEDEEAE